MHRKKISRKTRELVDLRAKNRCEYCQWWSDFSVDRFCIEYIVPISKDGSDELHNLAYSCGYCNTNKADETEAIDPVSGETVQIFHPRSNKWSVHFSWSDDFLTVIGKTKKGRATIVLLDINQQPLQNLRKIFRNIGMHPPFLA